LPNPLASCEFELAKNASPMPPAPIEQCYRYCPRCATENEALGAVPFRCLKCGFAQFFGPVAAVGGLVINDFGELLLVRRAREPGLGKWGLPGGFVDRHETMVSALCREIREETQLLVSHIEYLTTSPNEYNYHGIISPVIDSFYTCRADNAHKLQLAKEELEHFEWTQPDEEHLANMAFNSNRLAIEYWLQTHRKAAGDCQT
jgi:ADP-ribose pyrophosphatase YjhB (NUDIX family)